MQFISPGTPTASALHCLQWVNWGDVDTGPGAQRLQERPAGGLTGP